MAMFPFGYITALEELAETAAPVAGGITGLNRIYIPSLIATGLEHGASGRTMLAQLRTAGFSIGNERFYRLVGQIQAQSGQIANLAHVLAGGQVTPEMITPLEGGRAGVFQVNVRSFWQYVDDNGDLIQEERTTSILQRDLTLNQALRDTTALFAQIPPNDTTIQGSVVGLSVSGVYQYSGRT